MLPVRPSSTWQTGRFAGHEEGTSQGRFKNQSGKCRTWRPVYQQAFPGSIREVQVLAFWRKLKIQQNYKKLQWKVKKAPTSQESQFTDHYPDHLKHLYLAEEERLRKQRRKVGLPPPEEQVDQPMSEEECNTEQTSSEDHQSQPQQLCTLNSVTIPKKKKTSNQKAQEKYEQIQAKHAAKKFEFEMRKRELEEAQRLYKRSWKLSKS
ncbi:thyroid transcription factor 1-associated protein 26-like [Mesocricetus auratus]|uniref:Thyroid transcription factor 1-associated protein 26-like n=1 Tax=Mesocricetus auratus TaxID=10036 RepID=A0ABM2XBQ8_MESAU|nr:thyroid transcription factor 1-associated protein 26-like [Mesocricetus auratus]